MDIPAVTDSQAGLTLAALVRQLLPGTPWSKARDLCRDGRVWVDGAAATDPARRMSAGQSVELRLAGSTPRQALTGLIVHLDADVVVVRKPAGLLTVPFERHDRDTLLALARVAVRRAEAGRGRPGSLTLRAVQRLDKETSGLVVFARSVAAQRHLQQQLAARAVTRRYLAIVHGRFAGWLTPYGVSVANVACWGLVLFTYYGVNFFLVGLHSYAGGAAAVKLPPLLIAYLLFELVVIGVGIWYTKSGRLSAGRAASA